MFLLTVISNPMASELYDWSAEDLADLGDPKLFSTAALALAHVEALCEERHALDAEYESEEEKDRLLNEDARADGTTVWVFGPENGDPTNEPQESFVWAFCRPIALTA